MTLPFDDEDEDDGCVYEVDACEVRSVDDARVYVARARQRVVDGRALRPLLTHSLLVSVRDGMDPVVRRALFPALVADVDDFVVKGEPWPLLGDAVVGASIADAFERGTAVRGVVTSVRADGVVVDIGQPAFLPTDQIDLAPVRRLEPLLGRTLDVRVVRFHLGTGDLVVSRRALLEERRDALARHTRGVLRQDAVLPARVSTLTSYAAFVDLGGVGALLHVADEPTFVGRSPVEVLAIGEQVAVRVLRCEEPVFVALVDPVTEAEGS